MTNRPRGKWSDPGVPHRGWTCVDFEDLEDLSGICGMCESQEIRYVHYMRHPRYGELIGAGCECAAKMSEDYEAAHAAAKSRERFAKNRAKRRATWLTRNWKTSTKGNSYLKADGFVIVIFQKGLQWSAVIEDKVSEKKRFSQRSFKTEDEAKLAAFDGMTKLKADWRKTPT
jgi:hypothetical protein